MDYNSYPFNNKSLMSKVNGLNRLVESLKFSVEDHELRLDIYESVELDRYSYELFERNEVEIVGGWRKGEESSAWIRQYNFPSDVADSPEEALAAALRWVDDYYPKQVS